MYIYICAYIYTLRGKKCKKREYLKYKIKTLICINKTNCINNKKSKQIKSF